MAFLTPILSRTTPNCAAKLALERSDWYDSTALRRGAVERAGTILRSFHPDLAISKQKLRRAQVIQLVREKRETANQTLGFASRPFVLCGLPVTGHPSYGLPWGQDRLVPLYLATRAIRQ